MIKFQYFSGNVQSINKKPLGYVSLERFIIANKLPKQLDIFKQIAEASAKGNKELKSQLKQDNLYFFTPCINLDSNGIIKEKKGKEYLSYRCYDNIKSFTELLVLDFDGINNAEELKQHIFAEHKWVVASWLSPSKRGVKCLVKIPIVQTTDEFKEYFYGITEVFDSFDGFDQTTQNCVLPLFQSYDDTILYRTDATTFTHKGTRPEAYDYTPIEAVKVITTDNDQRRVYHNIRTGIERINTEGHPQLRSTCLSAGGYVASGYITFDECERFIHELIRQNGYLRKGIYGYSKTATWAINEGTKRQLTL